MTGHHGAPSSGTAPRVRPATIPGEGLWGPRGSNPPSGGLSGPGHGHGRFADLRFFPPVVTAHARPGLPVSDPMRTQHGPAPLDYGWLRQGDRSGVAAWQLRVVGFPSRVEGYMGPYDGRP